MAGDWLAGVAKEVEVGGQLTWACEVFGKVTIGWNGVLA